MRKILFVISEFLKWKEERLMKYHEINQFEGW